MIRNILIVDDDKIWLRLIQKKFEKHKDAFSALVAGDGLEAVEKLKQQPVSLVVTDMQMPRMDGLALLAHLSAHYPEIPVIVVTAYSTPKLKKAVLQRGGAGYIEKPFVVEDLARKITDILRKESEGGILQTVPLEMFIQLIEMEQKTCTIRVFSKLSGNKGVLFFREGELMDAKLPGHQGETAAYEMFSWDEVSLAIQDTCAVSEKRIDKDLQAILLDAMRLKDEAGAPADFPAGSPDNGRPGNRDALAGAPLDLSPAHPAGKRWEDALNGEKGVVEIVRDSTWDRLLEAAGRIGNQMGAGRLKACFISRGDPIDMIVVPGDESRIVMVDASCPRDTILRKIQ